MMSKWKFTIALFLLLCFVPAYSQKASIYGIPFGTSFSEVENCLDKKLFTGKYTNFDNSILSYNDVNMAGITFGTLIINFCNTGYDNVMVKAHLSSCYKSNTAQLKKDRDKLYIELSKKYSYIRSYINSIGYKSYQFGFSKDYIVGELGVLVLEKSQSNFGMNYYYLDLSYSPKLSDWSDL